MLRRVDNDRQCLFRNDADRHFGNFFGRSIVACAIGAGLIIYQFWRSAAVLPIPDGDSIYFYPVALSLAHGRGLVNPWILPIAIPGSGPGGPLIWHGWLTTLLLGRGAELIGSDIRAVLYVESLIIVLGLIIFCSEILPLFRSKWTLALASSLIVYGDLSASQGRPELVAAVLLLVWRAAELRVTSEVGRTAVAILLLGLLAVTDPTAALLSSVFYLTCLLAARDKWAALRRWIAINVGAALLMMFMTNILYPFSFTTWLHGLALNVQFITRRTDSNGVLYYYFTTPSHFMIGIALIYIAIIIGKAQLRRPINIPMLCSLLCSAALVWYMAFRIPATNYNIFVFLPVIIMSVLTPSRTGGAGDVTPVLPTSRFGKAWFGFFLGIVSVGIFIPLASTVYSAVVGESRTAFVSQIAALGTHARLALSPGLLVGAVPVGDWPSVRMVRGTWCENDSALTLFQQANGGLVNPPERPGCVLAIDRYSHVRMAVHGWRISFVPKAYNFAAYKPASAGVP